MRKQTKLVAVLSTAALLAIGASMTSFAATGWAEEDGTWVYYNRDGERVKDQWKKSGNNWYWLDSSGEMAIDQLINDGENYYYVDINGVMASNQWVAVDNSDAGQDNEPDHYWYYFQANGKALKNGDNSKVALKTVNGKKYAFDDEGRMLFGWVASDNAERIDDTDGDAFLEGDYYFGGEDDGAMTVGWLQMDITYDAATSDDYKEIAPVFSDDEDQTRWFYFKANGKKLKAEDGDKEKEKTINGKKYAFDEYGAMLAEWSADVDSIESASKSELAGNGSAWTTGGLGTHSTAESNGVAAKYAQEWRYFQDVENGARVSKGWFKVVSAEYLNYDKYNDDEDAWYYADGSGNLYAGEFKTIKGKKYAFRNDGRMVDGLKFIKAESYRPGQNGIATKYTGLDVQADDNDIARFDTEEDFDNNASAWEYQGYKCYYFGNGDDGSMKTGKNTVEIDGDKFNFYFEKSGGSKGAGVTGVKDDKYYQSGKLLKAGSDEKYEIVERSDNTNVGTNAIGAKKVYSYQKLDDIKDIIDGTVAGAVKHDLSVDEKATLAALQGLGVNKKAADLSEAYIFDETVVTKDDFFLVNTSGKVIDTKSKNKDGSDYIIVVEKGGRIAAIYVES